MVQVTVHDMDEQAEPTENELAIAKAEAKVQKMKHIDGRTLGLDYVFPLLRKMAAESGDIADDLQESVEALQSQIAVSDGLVDTLESARGLIVSMANLLDQTMVAAGFCNVSKKGDVVVMSVSDKMPKELRPLYEQIGPTAAEVVTSISAAIEASEAEDEEEDDTEEDVEVADKALEYVEEPDGVVAEFSDQDKTKPGFKVPVVQGVDAPPAVSGSPTEPVSSAGEGSSNGAA